VFRDALDRGEFLHQFTTANLLKGSNHPDDVPPPIVFDLSAEFVSKRGRVETEDIENLRVFEIDPKPPAASLPVSKR
jgi:hypothetical protein